MPRGRKRTPRESLRPLTAAERAELQRALRARNVPRALYLRAGIILAASDGNDDYEIAALAGCDQRTARKWIDRFNAQGLPGLRDAPRPGQPPRYSAEARLQAVALLCRRPADVLGDKAQGRTSWTLELLSQALLEQGYTHRLVPVSLLLTWLRQAHVSFKQAKGWQESTDPDFERKKGPS